MDKQFTAEEIIDIIMNKMENGERWQLLNIMFDEYSNKGDYPKLEIDEDY